MKTINYKCRNCGATVKHSHLKNVLTCAYCNTTFDNVVKLEDVPVDNLIEKLQIHSYKCSFCGCYFNSEKKVSNPVCPGCNNSNLEESNLIVNGVVLNELIETYVINDFKNELVGIEKYIPNEFFVNDFSLKYIKSKMYDGVINITAESRFGKTINKKYVFFDLIIPDSDTFNYSDIYHVMKNKIESKTIYYDKKSLSSVSVDKYEVNDRKSSDILEFEKVCLENFKKSYPKCKGISVQSSIDVKYNFYIPVFQKCTIYNGKKYYNSIIGFRSKNKNKSHFCLNFPPISESDKRSIKSKILYCKFIFVLNFIIMIFLFVAPFYESFKFIGSYSMVAIIILLILGVILRFKIDVLSKQLNIYLNDTKLTKKEFLDELIKKENDFIFSIEWRE